MFKVTLALKNVVVIREGHRPNLPSEQACFRRRTNLRILQSVTKILRCSVHCWQRTKTGVRTRLTNLPRLVFIIKRPHQYPLSTRQAGTTFRERTYSGASIIQTSLNRTTTYPNSSSGGLTPPRPARAPLVHLSLVRLLLYSIHIGSSIIRKYRFSEHPSTPISSDDRRSTVLVLRFERRYRRVALFFLPHRVAARPTTQQEAGNLYIVIGIAAVARLTF
ncbi:hypothetical protein EVAR_80666_1 [Eumeta japonica]|uniref:Uncharacterized protein n=1 Tax=Eumeta variegata TaxID=151549 RepID=A0A4C1U3J2_EUMVA|nr:hypothetical protein EVAR_80666_1 [Eumeta japonica]